MMKLRFSEDLKQPKEVEIEMYMEEDFDNMLNDCYPEVIIAGITFSPSQILKEYDPIAYDCGFGDYQEYETKYACPICGKQYDDEDEAKYCCQLREDEDELLGVEED